MASDQRTELGPGSGATDSTQFLPLARPATTGGDPSAAMLYAHLQLRAPEAGSILVASALSSHESLAVALTLGLAVAATGRAVRLVDVSGASRLADEKSDREPLEIVSVAQAELWDRDRLGRLLSAFDGLTIAAGGGVLDSPTMLIAAAAADAVVLSVKQGKTSRRDLDRARIEIERSGGRLVGAVLTR